MNEHFVTYEINQVMRFHGFDEPCIGFYNKDLDVEPLIHKPYITNSLFGAPLRQQALEWLRNKHKIYIQTEIDCTSLPKYAYAIYWILDSKIVNALEPRIYSDLYYSVKQAEEDAIMYAFNKLI